jgi:DNA-binding PadR family transcriptional regulator
MPNTSTLEMAILGLLRGKPQTGYDLRKTFTTTAMRHYSDSPGSIYPALRRLENRGWIREIRPAGSRADDRRRRHEFALTEAGREALIAWLEQQVTVEDVRFRLVELMLRFAFMDGCINRSDAVRFLDQVTQGLVEHVGEMHSKFKEMSAKTPPLHTGLLAFELGIRSMETQLAWARDTCARLREKLQ